MSKMRKYVCKVTMKSENAKPPLSAFFVDLAPQDEDLKKIQGRFSPAFLLLITIVGIATAEIIAMIIVYFYRYLPYYLQVLIDASIMLVIIFPILYFLSFRPILQHIKRRYQVEKEILAREQREKELLQTIYTIQLDIARDLHDTVGQNIGFLRMKLDYLADKPFKKAEMNAEIQQMKKAANEAYDLIRGTLTVLQSGNSADLFQIFSRYAEQIQERSGFEVDFQTEGDAQSLPAKRLRQLFFIFREALNNVEKHAHATQVTVKIHWQPDSLIFIVRDNGVGFDASNVGEGSHYGLKFMRDRIGMLNGFVDIQSVVGAGSTIVIKMPYE